MMDTRRFLIIAVVINILLIYISSATIINSNEFKNMEYTLKESINSLETQTPGLSGIGENTNTNAVEFGINIWSFFTSWTSLGWTLSYVGASGVEVMMGWLLDFFRYLMVVLASLEWYLIIKNKKTV